MPRVDAAVRTVVKTVLGPVEPGLLGVTLPHEHLLIDQRTGPEKRLWDLDVQAGELESFRAAGGGCVVDVTPPELGRDAAGLADLSRRSGVHVVMGTGHFLERFCDEATRRAPVGELVEEMAGELTEGPCGILGEIGLDWPHTELEERVLAAAGRASAETGAALSVHPGRDARSPFRALEVVAAAGGDPGRVVIGHLERTLRDRHDLIELAATGCYLEIDLFGHEEPPLPNDAERRRLVLELAEAGCADRLLISQDTADQADLLANGGPGYAYLLTGVAPALRTDGASEDLIQRLLVANPAAMLAMKGVER